MLRGKAQVLYEKEENFTWCSKTKIKVEHDPISKSQSLLTFLCISLLFVYLTYFKINLNITI